MTQRPERNARFDFWVTVLVMLIILGTGIHDLGKEAFAFGSACVLVGAVLMEKLNKL